MTAPQASSRLEMLQARFQQKQLQEKEQKLLQLYDQQQQRAYQVVQRGSAGSSSSNHGSTVRTAATTTATAATHTTSTSQGGKVRQMFDERRQTTVKGIDRSYPLEPLENKLRKQTNTNGVVTQRNGNVTVNRQSVKRVSRADVNSNVNGGKPVVSYHEEIIRESFGPPVRRHDDDDEYGVENRVATFANGYYRHEADNEQEEVLDQDTMERNRMMAKIHLMGYDETLKHRVRNDLESEEFPEYLMVDVPDKLSKRNVTKKLSQAEERLERFKNANAKRSNMSKQSNSTSTVIRKRSKQMVPTKSNSRPWSEIARTSPSSARSGSSRTSERSQRILACAKSPLPSGTSRIVDDVNARRTESSDTETFIRPASPRSFSMRETAEVASSPKIRRNEFKSLTSDGKIFMRHSASPRFFCKESERSGTTIDRKSDSSGSPLFYRETLTKRNKSPPVFLSESEQSRRTSESKSPIWYDKRISSRESTSPPYLRRESKRSETALSTDRETIGSKSSEWSTGTLTSTNIGRSSSASKSPSYKEEILKRRSTSPQFFCRESERGGTTMSIDRATNITSPSYLYGESKQSERALSTDRKTIGSKLSEWNKEITKRDMTDVERKKIETNRQFFSSKSPSYKEEILTRQSSSPQFSCRKSERSGTNMNIDRKHRLSLREQKVLIDRLLSGKAKQQSAFITNIDRKYNGFKLSGIVRDRRTTSPQFFCKESEKSATTMLIEPKSKITDSKDILKERDYISNTSYRQSVKSPSSIDKKIGSTQSRYSPLVTRYEQEKASKKNEINAVTNTRRSSKISEASASSIVNLRYGLEFDNIFQSAGLVRKFMKSQDGEQRETRQSPSRKRNIKDVNARISARGNQSRNRHKTPSPFQTAKSPSLENRKRTTPELFRKSITPTEVDMEIQEIIMTDHRIERDKLQKTPSPISKRQIDGTYTKSNSRVKSKTSITYPVRKTHRQRESILESSVFKSERSLSERGRKSIDHRSDQEIEGSAISLSKLSCSPVSQSSQRIITRDRKENETKVSRTREQTRKQFARNESRYVATPRSTKHEKRQRANSRSPNQMGGSRPAGNRIGSPRVTSPDFSRTRKYRDDTVSPILHLTERTKGTRTTKVDQLQGLQSARLVRGAIKDRTLSADDECNRERGDENKNVAIDEVDAGIGVKYHTVVKTALNSGIKDRRKIARPNAVDRIASGKISPRETQKPMKSSTSKKTFSPTRECGRRHEVKSRISPRVSPLRKTTEISRSAGSPRIFSSRGVVSKADQTSTFSKFSTYSVKDRKRDSVPTAKKLMESFDKISAKRKIEEPREAVREFSKVRHEDKYERDFERTDSVESALKRFDSIGAEFERSCPSLRTSPDISLQTMNVQTKESIASKETTIPSSETTNRTISGSTLKSTVGKDLKEVENTARKSDLKMIQKETRSSGRPTRTETNFVENKQSLTKIRSPKCKRRLFESNSEKEERQKSSCSKARKNDSFSSVSFRFRKDETLSNVRSKSLDRDIARESKTLEETFSVKPLRSIEDIRKSIDNERNKLVAIEESRSAIANRRSASREDPNAARKIFLEADSARLTKVKSCVSRITKSPSPDSAATKQRETNVRTTRGSTPSSPSKSPDVAPRRTESRNQETKSSRKSTGKSTDSIGNKATTAVDTTDGTVLQNSSLYESTTRKSNAFMIDYDDRPSREDDAIPSKKSPMKKSSDVRSNDKQQAASSASGRPTSSNSGVNLIQDSSTKSKMAERERGKGMAKEGGAARGRGMEKSSSSGSKLANASSFNEDATNDTKGLIKCKTCGRSFAQNRIDLHENICSKTTTKKRKQFDPVMSRVKGTELEPFVKKSLSKRETKTKKPEAKSDWRRKHEEFINTIRYARETQARLAAGENLSDLPPPPASDTSDYIQCEHCGRKFNRSAAERHVPICKRMHDKKQTQASRMKH
ncbi:uncharacterized protein LOC105433956 isoform X2 [Pogonomyrmex barbatus]|uniref:Uncharacterized protein LOC105433956 isoform X2 n=1 Tax=Pogonomyrmex barbatus TaxID=144034 RepID=A0A8N1SAI3_9HYME|nr:uncharacterized protein LOC105433956 isoform X2 [Pogonomyrmex barbatus]